ncbi:MAG: alpha/beta hydrolase [Gammaproteobacteria bacterium]|nr:alpha/beta hydrolase [Gammaproteobacteria bacterium]
MSHWYQRIALSFVSLLVLFASYTLADAHVHEDITYVTRDDVAVSYDVIQAVEPNGAAVLLMSSGGWFSRKYPIEGVTERFGFLLDAGYTLVSIRHRSAPEFKVPDAVADVKHAIRHVRHHAADYGIDAERMTVMGFSSGGHLSLMLALDADAGDTASADPIAQTSNHVAAAVSYFPPVDLVTRVGPSDSFPALDFDPALAESVSPVLFADANDPPIFLLHGTEDQLVPLADSERMVEALNEVGAPNQLSVFEGAGHGFQQPEHQARARAEILAFLGEHLAAN